MPKFTFTCWDKNRASLWNTDVIEFASAADAKAHAEKLARSYARQGRVVEYARQGRVVEVARVASAPRNSRSNGAATGSACRSTRLRAARR